MAKKKNQVEVYHLICKDCGQNNYAQRLKKEHKSLEVKKYCPKTRTHELHRAKKS